MQVAVAVVLVEDLQQMEELAELEEEVQEHHNQLDNQELQELIPQVVEEEVDLQMIVLVEVPVVQE